MRRYKKQKVPYALSHFIQNSNYIFFQKSYIRFEHCLDTNLALDIYWYTSLNNLIFYRTKWWFILKHWFCQFKSWHFKLLHTMLWTDYQFRLDLYLISIHNIHRLSYLKVLMSEIKLSLSACQTFYKFSCMWFVREHAHA